jgi:hypothetical protein
MKVHAGDAMSASVTVSGTRITVVLKNRTTGVRFAKVLHASAPDVTSAEWIVEAPSACTRNGSCRILPLSDFGSVRFSGAHATSTGGHTGTPSHLAWNTTALTLSDASVGAGAGPSAVPSGLSAFGSSFTVTYQQSAAFQNARKRTIGVRHRIGG